MGCRNVFLAENSWASHLIRSANLHVEDKKDPEEKHEKTKRLIRCKGKSKRRRRRRTATTTITVKEEQQQQGYVNEEEKDWQQQHQ